jgi:hypothetical protein
VVEISIPMLTESDLRFVVETVATNRRDHDHVMNLVRGKDDLLEPMLDDPKLVDRLIREEESFVRISPHLFFSVLLRRVRKDLEQTAYVLEVDPETKRIPIFEAPAVAELLGDKPVRDYLAEMLASFARTNSGVMYWKEHGAWQKKRFSDVDPDDMIALARIIDLEMRPLLYKRIADIALFLSGIFPAASDVVRGRGPKSDRAALSPGRTVKDYEQLGRRFYRIAAREADQPRWRPVFETLTEKFTLARRALNTLSDRYLRGMEYWSSGVLGLSD